MARQKRQKKYYALAGANGYGIYTDYDEAVLAGAYITKRNIKKFSDFESAKEWAEDRFYGFQELFSSDYNIQEITRVNWSYYKKTKSRRR